MGYVSGHKAVLKIGTSTVPGMDWKLDRDAKLKDVSNFLTGRSRMSTLEDCQFSCKVIFDDAAMPHDPAGLNLTIGANVTAKCYVDNAATKFYSVPLMISKVTVTVSGQEDVVMYDVSAELNGAVTEPVIG